MDRRERDMDLIMALAAGDLPPGEAARLERSLDADARKELAAQRAARDALAQLTRPAMSDEERRRMRVAVAAELRVETRSLDAPTSPPPRRWWRRLGALGAVTAVASLVAVIAISVNLVDVFDEADSELAPSVSPTTAVAPATLEVTAEAAPATTAAATTTTLDEEALRAEAEMAAASAQMADSEMAAEEAALGSATSTTVRPPRKEDEAHAFNLATEPTEEMVSFLEALSTRSGEPFSVSELAERAAAEAFECWQAVVDTADPATAVSLMARGLVDGSEAEVYVFESADTDQDPIISVFIRPGCLPFDLSS